MNNRIHNCTNPNQTLTKRVLCLCSAGLLRSPTMANTLHINFSFNTRSAGISPDYALIPVDEVLLRWADEVLCASEEIKYGLLRDYPKYENKVVNLRLPDMFEWNEQELIDCILEQYKELHPNLGKAKG